MLDLEIQPERSIGNEAWELILGMSLSQAINIIRSHDVTIKDVQLCYSADNPLTNDLIINLSRDGIRFTFDSYWQRLKVIEVYNLTLVKLRYCGGCFNSPHTVPTMSQIDQSFGATHPAVYSSEKKLMILNYRGLTFEFKVESSLEPQYSHGLGSLQFPPGFSPVVSRIFIFSGPSPQEASCPALPLSCFYGCLYLEKLEVLREQGRTVSVQFHISAEDSKISSQPQSITFVKTIKFGDSCQDVMLALGCPGKIFYKDEDKMMIHSAAQSRSSAKSKVTDYFFNYFTLGVDILFDGSSHQVKKFILHSNFPNHYDFNMYHRCYFNIPMMLSPGKQQQQQQQMLPPGDEPALICVAPTTHRPPSGSMGPSGSVGGGDSGCAELISIEDPKPVLITFDTKWNEVQDMLLSPATKPVVLNRSSHTNTTNPFGSSFAYGVQDVIFEVTSSQQIATVTLYRTSR